MTVAELLDASHSAHIAYRNAVRDGNKSAEKAALQIALDRRAEAKSADPEQLDPAWTDEAKTYPHEALMKFYDEQVNGRR